MPALRYLPIQFGGGVNSRDGITHLGTDLWQSQFWDYEREGSITSRSSFFTWMTLAVGSVPTAMWSVRNTANTVAYLLIHCAGNGAVFTSSDLSTTNNPFSWPTTQGGMEADQLNGSVWMVNGLDTPRRWDMTSGSTVISTVAAMPIARHIKMYKNYCFVAGTSAYPSRVWFSSVKDPTTWPTNNFQDVAPDDGDQITGLFGTPEGLMIFKQQSVWLMLGDTFDATNPQWRMVRLNTPLGVGGLGNTTPAFLEGVGVIWVAKNGIYGWNGTTVTELSAKIRPTVNFMNLYAVGYTANAAGLTGNTWNNRREASGTVFRGRYWLSVEQTTAANSPRMLLSLDQQGRWQIANETEIVGLVQYADTTYSNQLLACVNNARAIREMEIRRTVGGGGFNAGDARTGQIALSSSTRLTHVRRAFAIYSLDDTFGTMTMTLTFIPDGDASRQVTMTLTTAAGTAIGTPATGTLNLTERVYRLQQDVNFQARFLQIRLQSSVTSQIEARVMISLHELVLEVSDESIQGTATP